MHLLLKILFQIANKQINLHKMDFSQNTDQMIILSKLFELGLITIKDKITLQFPYFSEDEFKQLSSWIRSIVDRIIREVFRPNLSKLDKIFSNIGIKLNKNNFHQYFSLYHRIIMDYCLEYLIKKEIMSDFPLEAEPKGGVWGLDGKMEIFKYL